MIDNRNSPGYCRDRNMSQKKNIFLEILDKCPHFIYKIFQEKREPIQSRELGTYLFNLFYMSFVASVLLEQLKLVLTTRNHTTEYFITYKKLHCADAMLVMSVYFKTVHSNKKYCNTLLKIYYYSVTPATVLINNSIIDRNTIS